MGWVLEQLRELREYFVGWAVPTDHYRFSNINILLCYYRSISIAITRSNQTVLILLLLI